MSSGHHHHIDESLGDRRLGLAIAVNILLTLAQVVGGIVSGSLSLIADALHNFSDAAHAYKKYVDHIFTTSRYTVIFRYCKFLL